MNESEAKSGLSWMAKIFVILGVLVIALPILYVVAITIALKAHSKDDCRTLNMRHIGLRCRMHAANHDGQFPAKWSDLEWDDMDGIGNTTWDRAFVCPTVGHGPSDWKQVDLWSDYRLIPGRTTNDSWNTVLAIEPLSNHERGANVLFVDGS